VKLNLVVILFIAGILALPLALIVINTETAAVCVDPGATIEPDRILNCHVWEDQKVIQF